MILYYVPGACSLASHITLAEAGLPYDLVRIDRSKRTDDGRDFLAINPKGCVPALGLDDGTVLTESVAILAYLAHREASLLPTGDLARSRVYEALSFMATEVHGNFKPLFYPDTTEAEKGRALERLAKHFSVLADQLGDRTYLVGDHLSVADAYLFVMVTWAGNFGIEVAPRLTAYLARLKELPSFARALSEEGLS